MRLLDGINDTEDELYTFDSIIETKDENDALEALKKIKWKLEDEGILGKEYELCDIIEKGLKALEIIKTLFQGRCKLYERTEYIETCNEEGCHAEKIATASYILEFRNYDLHYEFHLHKEEYDLLKEVLNYGR